MASATVTDTHAATGEAESFTWGFAEHLGFDPRPGRVVGAELILVADGGSG